MAIGAAIFSGAMALRGARQQRSAGKQAQAAAEVAAQGIEEETEMNIEQTKRMQSQVLGRAKANIAASGIRFDASKIGAVEFSEGGTETRKVQVGVEETRGYGRTSTHVTRTPIYEQQTFVKEYGGQTAGATEGSATFNYLREMKRNFAAELGWQGKQGRSRAKVARMGGQVAKATAYAGGYQSYASAASSFASAYTAGKSK